MPHEVIMPALGMAQETGQIVAWLKAAGDAVKAGEPLMEVETDKATMEVEAQFDGFLADIRAEAGANVPVGEVVALIADRPGGTGEGASSPPAAPAASAGGGAAPDDLPEGEAIIMPALGMAQDTGILVAWLKAPGEAVGRDEVLLEVETDKSTMEVPAGADGYIAALLAEAGEEVPVGATIAVISTSKPENPVQRSAATGGAPVAPSPMPETAKPVATGTPAAAAEKKVAPAAVPTQGGRILASPKARRLAAAEGLDLARLRDAGVPQPFHVADLDTLRALPSPGAAANPAQAAASLHLTAEAPATALAELVAWIAGEGNAPVDAAGLLAGFAAGALRPHAEGSLIVAVERHGQRRSYADPDRGGLGSAPQPQEKAAPALILRDLRGSGLTGLRLGAEEAPVLTLTGDDRICLTLECAAGQLSPAAALDLMTGVAARLNDPLRHLL
ncbi:biotin/lipoyl-containing protein [Acidimangrovimonas sediminis]|uniref:biotin/lipoyl-containing protein n=1 Tax=Acidimangrovimonas sediminis TaxID=2056283 RepID=UPI000C7F939C|nr:biotin/lipoyl-containing protein [Acidimangrovimonas sediminis]